MNKSVWMISKLNLKNLKVPYIIIGVLFLVMLVQDIIKIVTASGDSQTIISIGNYLWLFIPFAAVYIATKNFRRIVNLGGKRKSFFKGNLVTYLILSGAVALISTLLYYTYDRFITDAKAFEGVLNLLTVFGWSTHGPAAVFFQQFAFLFLLAVCAHTLAAVQGSWIGWTVDIFIAAVLAVFIPIAPLRTILIGFFNLIIFQPGALFQILACLVLGGAIYALNLPIFNRKAI